jgi:hypothetical protein
MTDDDTKFERARRDAPHIEAFAQIKHQPPPPAASPAPRRRRTWAEIRAGWNATDEAHGTPRH